MPKVVASLLRTNQLEVVEVIQSHFGAWISMPRKELVGMSESDQVTLTAEAATNGASLPGALAEVVRHSHLERVTVPQHCRFAIVGSGGRVVKQLQKETGARSSRQHYDGDQHRLAAQGLLRAY